MTTNNPKSTGIILNWNSFEDTKKCIQSLLSQKIDGFDILLVDNGSTDGSFERLTEMFPDIEHIQNDYNLGFSGGLNKGIQIALSRNTDYIWILNNDIIIRDKRCLSKLIQAMESNEEIGILSPRVLNERDQDSVWFEHGTIDYNLAEGYHEEIDEKNSNSSTINYCHYVPFCCVLIRKEVFEQVGLLDERYFLYYEDMDYSTQASSSGFRIGVASDISVYHRINASSGDSINPIHSYYRTRNRWLFGQEYSNSLFEIYYFWWILKAIADRIIHFKYGSLIALFRGLADAIQSKQGKGPYPRS